MNSSSVREIVDQRQRDAAIDTSRSFAVQAPAGSGKTELLSLRYLKLLALCEQPEEVLAITFTRKAAAEMAERIISTLEWAHMLKARGQPNFSSDIEANRFAAAARVLARDELLGWELLLNPSRLRVQTIDSFCHHLASRLPLLSRLGAAPSVSEQIDDCMQEAVRETLALLETDADIANSIRFLLTHFKNDSRRVEALLISLLKKRDQWLGALLEFGYQPERAQAYLSGNLLGLIEEQLEGLETSLGMAGHQLAELAAVAAGNLDAAAQDSPLLVFIDAPTLPSCDAEGLQVWQALTTLLLTKQMTWRKTVTKKEGFPAASGTAVEKEEFKQRKSELLALIAELREIPGLLEQLVSVAILPPPFDGDTWPLLEAITSIVPTLVAQLHLAFTSFGKIDYTQISEAALLALGNSESPTDLALMLDYRIKHILVDEFQDTSSTQNALLERLTSGWTPGDGRTLFLVGDGMQSCYSFRNANVGLFLAARERGLGSVDLEPLDLLTNFRSERGIVDWVNNIFAPSFPAATNLSRGAVPYSPAQAFHDRGNGVAVAVQLLQHELTEATAARSKEAARVVERIDSLRHASPRDSIALLVRSRSHLRELLPALRAAGIAWQATEIDPLATLPVIDDLLSLLKATLSPADHLAWLCMLRAPWCGLQKHQLLALNAARSRGFGPDEEPGGSAESGESQAASPCPSLSTLLPRLLDGAGVEHNGPGTLDEFLTAGESRDRVSHLSRVLRFASEHRYDSSLSRLIRFCWQQLGADAFYQSADDQIAVAQFFELLEANENAGQIRDIEQFEARVRQTYVSAQQPAAGESGTNEVQVMTIHKAKGLEFDHVIIPGLARRSPADDKPLLLWHEHVNTAGASSLLMATLAASGSDDSKLYKYLRHEQALKQRFESTRLLYIAVTRARKSALLTATLHLPASADAGSDILPAPPAGSLLDTVWEALSSDPDHYSLERLDAIPADAATGLEAGQRHQGIRRFRGEHFTLLSAGQDLPPPPQATARENAEESMQLQILATDRGVLIHQALQQLSDAKLLQVEPGLAVPALTRLAPWWQRQLLRLGYTEREASCGAEQTLQSLQKVLASDQCNWIFSGRLTGARNEMAMNTLVNERLRTRVIDRSFVDGENKRWIIDYKSVQFSDLSSEEDIQRRIETEKTRYREQMEDYRKLLENEGSEEIVLALLFTDLPRLVTIQD